MYRPLFQGTISNWTTELKAVLWKRMGYSFIFSTSTKQVKVLELILSVSFAFESCCCEPTFCVYSLNKKNRQLLGFKIKANQSETLQEY